MMLVEVKILAPGKKQTLVEYSKRRYYVWNDNLHLRNGIPYTNRWNLNPLKRVQYYGVRQSN